MIEALISIDKSQDKSLQSQIREKLVEGILSGNFPAGMKLPSSRRLSKQLGVGRNTVTLVYQQLISEHFVITRERSGFFVADNISQGGISDHRQQLQGLNGEAKKTPDDVPRSVLFPFPFMDTLVDTELFPVSAWRESHRQVMAQSEISEWGRLGGFYTDHKLIDEIRTKILTTRGIMATPDEVLITTGYRGALSLLAQQAKKSDLRIGLQDPIEAKTRNCFTELQVKYKPVRNLEDDSLKKLDILCTASQLVWPGLSNPNLKEKESLLEKANARNVTIWECDPPKSFWAKDNMSPALKSLKEAHSTVFIGALCPVAMAGQSVGFIVGPRSLIKELHQTQVYLGQTPPSFLQRVAAVFLARGSYESASRAISQRFDEKWTEMSEALSYHLPQCRVTRAPQARSFWIQGPPTLDVALLTKQLEKRGVLIEPSTAFYHNPKEAERHAFHLSIQAIPFDRIEEGVSILAQVIREQMSGSAETADDVKESLLAADTILEKLMGLRILCTNPLGEPYEIILQKKGLMRGVANRGTPEEDADKGRWWVEEDHWVRQWDSWSYGRRASFRVAIQGRLIKWFREDGTLLDTGLILPD